MTFETAQPLAIPAGEGRSLWHLGALLTFKALSQETGGRFWALEGLANDGMEVPLHSHTHEDEVWYVLAGEITFIVGDQRLSLSAGSFAFVPRGTPHTFFVRSATAKWFGFGVPGGLDQWFFETGRPAEALTLPPVEGPPDVAQIVASLAAYGTETLGPPPSRE